MVRRVLALLVVAMLVAGTPAVLAAPNDWSLTVAPASVADGSQKVFALQATDTNGSGDIACVVLIVPKQFSVQGAAVTGTSVAGPWRATRAADGGGRTRVEVFNDGGGAKLKEGDWVRFTITATGLNPGSYQWRGSVTQGEDCQGDGFGNVIQLHGHGHRGRHAGAHPTSHARADPGTDTRPDACPDGRADAHARPRADRTPDAHPETNRRPTARLDPRADGDGARSRSERPAGGDPDTGGIGPGHRPEPVVITAGWIPDRAAQGRRCARGRSGGPRRRSAGRYRGARPRLRHLRPDRGVPAWRWLRLARANVRRGRPRSPHHPDHSHPDARRLHLDAVHPPAAKRATQEPGGQTRATSALAPLTALLSACASRRRR